MTSSKKVFLGVCLLVLLLAALVVLTRPDLLDEPPLQQAEAKPALTVSTAAPQRIELPVRLPADGNIVPWQEASIASESNGLKLAEVQVDVGDTVTQGQVLARFATETALAELTQARAALSEAQAALSEAQANARRAERLSQTGAISQQLIVQYQVAERTAQARVRSARAALDARRQNWRYTELRSPDDGVISARTATVGSVPGSGTELFRLIRQGRLEWQAEVNARDLHRIAVGSEATLRAADGSQVAAKVRALAPAADLKTRTALVYLALPPHPAVRAGMFLSGSFELGRSMALTVPIEALVPRDGFNYVYRLLPDERVRRVRVTTGRHLADQVEIMPADDQALNENVQIVVQGAGFLSDGDRVRVSNGSAGGTDAQADAAAGRRVN